MATNVQVPRRKFGNTGVEVSVIGLGCMGMSEFYGPAEEDESFKVIELCLQHGINFFDTADAYGVGRNEELLGKAIKKFGREKFFIATKFGIVRDPDGSWKGLSGKPEYVKKACEASLKRLGIDYIDLYYLHRLDQSTPIEDTVGAMAELVKEGKVKYLGLSEVGPENLRRASKIHPITALQSEYSLWSTDIEDKIIPTCRELGIAIVPYSPLGRGLLTGQIKSIDDLAADDWRRANPRFQPEHFQKNIELVKKIEEFSKQKGCTPSQLALAWVLSNGQDMFPIPGTKRVKYLLENIGAVNVKFTEEELKALRSILSTIPVSGDRYSDMSSIKNAL
eukprot:TRINITY_DN28121_c0_g1_i1.p1 TRINITY_DN28121_c0_g1~~TRINITY_DN28121_c0_g1_i1.p1  ORF type:complete len:336 (-),score=118.31 TRINITY_DN28121_c0_g1_i1:91-1098(-)